MKTREVRVSYGITVNLGSYESGRVEAGIVADLEPGETEEQAFSKAFKKCLSQVVDRMEELADLAKRKG